MISTNFGMSLGTFSLSGISVYIINIKKLRSWAFSGTNILWKWLWAVTHWKFPPFLVHWECNTWEYLAFPCAVITRFQSIHLTALVKRSEPFQEKGSNQCKNFNLNTSIQCQFYPSCYTSTSLVYMLNQPPVPNGARDTVFKIRKWLD